MRSFLKFVFSLVLILSIFPLYSRYKVAAAPIPPGVYLGGLEMSHYKERAQIEQTLRQRYRDPIAVYFGDERLVLRPQEIDFRIDVETMLQEAEQYLQGEAFLDIAFRKLLGLPQKRRDVPLRYTYDPAKLGAWLQRVAEEQNRVPQPSRALPPIWAWRDDEPLQAGMPAHFVGNYQQDWQWSLGNPGQKLRMEESVRPILEAFASADARTAHLVLDETPPPAPSMDDLGRVLDSFLADFPGFAAVYVRDLTSGEEATVDVDVAFSGMSTLKVAIVSEIFRQMEDVEDVEVGQLIDHALGESSNFAANRLLSRVGGGDIFGGARRVTAFMRRLGFTNTYIQTGYDDKTPVAEIPTAANQRTDWNTDPDTHLQSTPADMGRLLSAIYDCTQGKGLLLETFGDAFTADECRHILFYMSHDEFRELVWGGLPRPGRVWIVHKHGFVNEAHSDLALVWGPSGPYVIAVYLFRRGWMDWATSNGTMKEVSRIVWNFFDFKGRYEGVTADPPPDLPLPPNYIPVNTYTSRAATQIDDGTSTHASP